ncbi:MAG: hypothetical protein KKF08_19115 [Gammaproteobacteria bacterium]|nr:hypothetical protein [Gammaproteobacteria bacterium]
MNYNDIIDSGKVFKILNDNERQVLKLRFGFEDGQTRSQDETASIMKITKSRISQIESRAKEKINLILQFTNKQEVS